MAIRRTRRSTARIAAKGARKTTGRRTTGRRTGAKATRAKRTRAKATSARGPATFGAAATGRSAKAGRPPTGPTARPQARRRQRSASTAVKKNGTLMQTDQGTKVLWGANQRRPTRV